MLHFFIGFQPDKNVEVEQIDEGLFYTTQNFVTNLEAPL